MNSKPLISVLVPIYNGEKYLREAIESVLQQTYSNFELLAIDDGSTDHSKAILQDLQTSDSRIRILSNEGPKGIVGALNTGISHAKGEFIARMDSDDICLPNRFALQTKFLSQNPHIGLCGTWVQTIGLHPGYIWQLPIHNDEIRVWMLFYGAIAHPTVMWRRSAFEEHEFRYDQEYIYAEDYELWVRAAGRVELANFPQILLRYRTHAENTSTVRREIQEQNTQKIHLRQLSQLGLTPNPEELDIHQRIFTWKFEATQEFVTKTYSWLDRIFVANQITKIYNPEALNKFLTLKKKQIDDFRLSNPPQKIVAHGFSIRYRLKDVPFYFKHYTKRFIKRFTPSCTWDWIKKLAHALKHQIAALKTLIKSTLILICNLLNVGFQLKRQLPKRFKIGMAVLAHERPEYLDLCLNSLFSSDIRDYDITFLIIDDGSKDPRVREIIERPRSSRYKIIREFTPKGPNNAGAAINKAIRKLYEIDQFDIIGWSDPDALYHPDWLHKTLEICLWAKRHHFKHTLGPFSSFNSSDYVFHQVLGTYPSPHGNFVVKRQMGMLNYFYFREDFEKLGYFQENPDDETLMTHKFEQLGVRNFCTETSYVEHLGQISVLNQWRPTPLRRAVFGMNLAPGNWGPYDFERLSPYGFYRYLQTPKTFGIGIQGAALDNVKIDVLFVASDQDCALLTHTIRSVRSNLLNSIDQIYIVGPSNSTLKDLCIQNHCKFIDEQAVLPFTLSLIPSKVLDENHRKALFQQFLKLSADQISKKESIYILNVDTLLEAPQYFLDTSGKTVFLVSDEYHIPYYDTFYRIFGYSARARYSFSARQMLFSAKKLREMKSEIESRNPGRTWYEAILDSMDFREKDSFSEYETYANWLLEHDPDIMLMEYWHNQTFSKRYLSEKDSIGKQIKGPCRSLSFL